MKIIIKLISLSLILILILAPLALQASAKDLEPCNLCNTKGTFSCPSCHNKGETICDLCGGQAYMTCTGEEGKGKCNNGFYTCPSCHGDGKCRTGDGEIVEGSCGNCGGSGKVECWRCHGKGVTACTRCNGQGKQACQNENCIQARKIGYKCPKCKGAGYLLTNFWPGENDGKQNAPKKGDKIWVNGKSTTYGGSSSDSDSGNTPQTTAPSGGNKGDSKTQEHTTNRNDGPPETEPDINEETETQNEDPVYPVPHDRGGEYQLPASDGSDSEKNGVSVRIETDAMTDEERAYYESLPDNELAELLQKVQLTAESILVAAPDEETDDLIMRLSEQNGFDSPEDGRMIPIFFDGHLDIGFPVKVRFKIDKGVLDGGADIHVYHVTESGKIEYIGQACDIGTYEEDGSIEYMSFYTKSFCTFFTAKTELNLDITEPIPEQNVPNYAVIFIIVGVVLVFILIAAVTVIAIRKKKNKD